MKVFDRKSGIRIVLTANSSIKISSGSRPFYAYSDLVAERALYIPRGEVKPAIRLNGGWIVRFSISKSSTFTFRYINACTIRRIRRISWTIFFIPFR